MINKIKQYDWKKYNYSLLIVVILLCLISAFTVKLAGGDEAGMRYMRNQLVGMVLGLIIVAGLSVLDYHFICKFTILYYPAGLLLTAATHTSLGTDNHTDAVRWIELGGITFQPSELMKIILILTLATVFTKLRNRLDRISTLLIAGAVTVLPVGFVVQPGSLLCHGNHDCCGRGELPDSGTNLCGGASAWPGAVLVYPAAI